MHNIAIECVSDTGLAPVSNCRVHTYRVILDVRAALINSLRRLHCRADCPISLCIGAAATRNFMLNIQCSNTSKWTKRAIRS